MSAEDKKVVDTKKEEIEENTDGGIDFSFKPSAVSLGLRRLKSSAFKVINSRDKLPHTLFWSLFNSEVERLREEKEKDRLLRKVLYGIDL